MLSGNICVDGRTIAEWSAVNTLERNRYGESIYRCTAWVNESGYRSGVEPTTFTLACHPEDGPAFLAMLVLESLDSFTEDKTPVAD